tara:strand:- start:5727 stop:6149 length:423 start_codon:yes stop_codon:yes gene_type:complete
MNKDFEILLGFIKDLSVETPSAETLLFVRDNLKNYHLGIDINSKALKNKMIEVSTKLSFKDKSNSEKKSIFELNYASVVRINENIKDKKRLEKILLCDLQKEIYPKIEGIFLKLLNDSGFKGVKFEKRVDFEKLYMERLN